MKMCICIEQCLMNRAAKAETGETSHILENENNRTLTLPDCPLLVNPVHLVSPSKVL